MIPIFEPYLVGNEKKYIHECIESNWISSQGKYIELFEKALSDYHNKKYCIATSSCTTAIHLSLKSLGIGPKDEVICPALTFIAPANMVKLSGAKLVLVDIDPTTMTIDPLKIEEKININTKAIIVVHQFGHSAHMDEIIKISKKYKLKIIEDNAESLGAKYKGHLLGTLGHVTTLSFFANKIITCGEGGALLTDDEEIAHKARILRDHGMSRDIKYLHVDLGYNYRMTNMQAAVGLAQIEKLDEILSIRKKQMDLYYKLFENSDFINLRKFENWTDPVHWLMTLSLNNGYDKSEVISQMLKLGIECRQMVNPVSNAKHFKKEHDFREYPNANIISKSFFHLPSSTGLSADEINFISVNLNKICC